MMIGGKKEDQYLPDCDLGESYSMDGHVSAYIRIYLRDLQHESILKHIKLVQTYGASNSTIMKSN